MLAPLDPQDRALPIRYRALPRATVTHRAAPLATGWRVAPSFSDPELPLGPSLCPRDPSGVAQLCFVMAVGTPLL